MLKKYPNLLKEGKNVKLKVVGKDCNGRPVVKHITLKAAAASSASAVAMKKQPYSARRGRPKRVRDGEGEETELHKRTEVFATLDQVAAGATAEVGGGAQHRQQRQQQQEEQRMDSSSEAEALSNVASGIAASLGLAAGNLDHEGRVTAAAVVVPTSAEDGGESSGGGGGGGEVSELGQQETAIMIDYQDLSNTVEDCSNDKTPHTTCVSDDDELRRVAEEATETEGELRRLAIKLDQSSKNVMSAIETCNRCFADLNVVKDRIIRRSKLHSDIKARRGIPK